jgi:hypothetical protein
MPLPTNSMMHQNRPLETMTIATMQEDASFILMSASGGALEEVEHKSDTYYIFNAGDWNRMEMQPRGPSQESEGGGWRLSTDSFQCDRRALHKDWDYSDSDNADVAIADTDEQAKLYLANQGRIYGDYLMGTEVMAAAVWTDDLDGTTGSPTVGTSFVQWDQSSGDPQADSFEYTQRIHGRIGMKPNTWISGAVAHSRLLQNDTVRDAIKYTQLPSQQAIEGALAKYLGVERYFVANGFRNTAAEGATASLSYLCDSKAAWLGYVAQESGKYTMSAYKLFAWKHAGKANKGIVIRSIDMPWKTSIRHEIETFWDVKVVSADAGVFFDAAVA